MYNKQYLHIILKTCRTFWKISIKIFKSLKQIFCFKGQQNHGCNLRDRNRENFKISYTGSLTKSRSSVIYLK